MTGNVSATAQSNLSRPMTYDAGEMLKAGVDSVLRDDTNVGIDAQISNIDATLRSKGVRNTAFVGQLLYCFRGVQAGVPGDLQKFKQAVAQGQRAGVLGPRGAASLLQKVGVAQQQQNQQNNDNSPMSVNRQVARSDRSVFEPGDLLKATSYGKPQDIFTSTRTSPSKTQRPVETEKKPAVKREASPALENAISATDAAAKSMPEGMLKDSVEGINSTLEMMKEAQTTGDTATVARCATDLSKATFNFVGHLVETVGQDPKLAEQAAGTLGSIGKVLGSVAKPVRALDDASRAILGRTLTGKEVGTPDRVNAAVDLAATLAPGPVGAGIVISKMELEALYNYIGVPAHRAIEDYGLKQLFGGKTPDEMKAQINAMSSADASSNATVKKLMFDTFKNTTSGMSEATANSMWRTFVGKEMSSDSEWIKQMVNQDPKKPNGVPDMLRETVADRMKATAIRFIDEQVREAKGNW